MARAPRLRSRRLGTAVGAGLGLVSSILLFAPGPAGATAVTPNPPCYISIQIGPFTQYLVADPCPYPPTTVAPTTPPTPVPTTVPESTAATVAAVTTSTPPAPAAPPLPAPAPSPTPSPPPPPQAPPPLTTIVSTTSTSTSTSTTTTTTTSSTLPPVQPLRPPPPSLRVTAVWSPQRPVPGELATVTVEVRNDGVWPVDDLVLTDDVSASSELRSVTSEAGPCTVAGRRAQCSLGTLPPGAVATIGVRVLIAREPASRTLVHQISLGSSSGGGAEALVSQQSVSALSERPPTQKLALLDLPGPTVTIVVFLSFALAARKSASG